MSHAFDMERFERMPIVGILRGMRDEWIESLVGAFQAGGLINLEITMNTPGAAAQIRQAIMAAAGELHIGAGTVTSLSLLNEALEAGAQFIVTPIVTPDVIRRCKELGVPIFPGAFSPTEILAAWELGATMVKIFPAEAVGPEYLKNIKGPLPFVRLMPTGGVDLKTLADYRRAGAEAFGIGGPLFDRERMAAGDWNSIRARCAAFHDCYERVR